MRTWTHVLFSAFLVSRVLSAATADSFEPDSSLNNTGDTLTSLGAASRAAAKPIVSGVPQTHSIHVGGTLAGGADRDIVRFTLGVDSDLIIQTDLGVGAADTVLRLYDSAGVELFEDDEGNPAGNNLSRLTITDMPAGTYYVSVEEFSIAFGTARTIESYKLTLLAAAAGTRFSPVITSPTAATSAVGARFSYFISTLGSSPVSFTAAGLPDGLSLTGQMITGTPAAAGTFNITLTANNGVAPNGTLTLSLTVTDFGVITSIAGDGKDRFAGDGGPGVQASLSFPADVALDGSNRVLIADANNNVIRRVDQATGDIVTIAGSGIAGNSGDNGDATSARLNFPSDMCVDAAGNIYIADTGNSQIRKVTPAGIITLFNNTLLNPVGICVDASGNLYVADDVDHAVYKLNAAGVATLYAGTTVAGFNGESGPATAIQLNSPVDVCLDANGNLYISDQLNHRVRRVTPGGMMSTIAGSGSTGSFSGDGGLPTMATLNTPTGLAADLAGNIYVVDVGNNRVRRIVPGSLIETIIGGGIFDFSQNDLGARQSDGGAALGCVIFDGSGLAVDASGAVYLADASAHLVRKTAVASAPAITSNLALTTPKGTPLNPPYRITYTGHPLPTFSASGLPQGLSLVNNTISGIPTQSGVADVILTATNSRGSDKKTLRITLPGSGAGAPLVSAATDITVSPNPARAGSMVTFVAPSISDPDSDLLAYTWDFGDAADKSRGMGQVAGHTYRNTGLYTATLKVTDGTTEIVRTGVVGVNASDVTEGVIITKAQFKFDFQAQNRDSLSLAGIAPFRKDRSLAGSSVTINVGALSRTFTLDAKGSGQGNGKSDVLKFAAKTTSGTIDAAGKFVSGKFSRTIKAETLSTTLATLGFLPNTTTVKPIKVPILISINGDSYVENITVVFKSTTKSGTGTKLKEGGTLPTR